MSYCFIPYNEMVGLLNIKDVEDTRNVYSDFFLDRRAEVVYVVDDDSHLIGVVTPSNLDRLYYNEVSSPVGIINTDFSFLRKCDFEQAAVFFNRYKKCHEIPVIMDDVLEGIVYDGEGKSEKEWKAINRVVSTRLRMERDIEWYCKEIKRLSGSWYMTNVLIYGNMRDSEVIDKLDEKEKESLLQRKGLTNRQICNEVLKNRWNEPGYFDAHEKIRLVSIKGAIFPRNLESECINIRNNHRIVQNTPLDAKRRVFIFGPCNVFGTFVSDDQTIETYLQNICNKNGYSDVEIVNCGLMGPEKSLDSIFVSDVNGSDIIIILTPGFDWVFKENFPESYRGCLSGVYDNIDVPTEHFLDNVRHCDGVVHRNVAERIWEDLKISLSKNTGDPIKLFGANYFIAPEVRRYFDGYIDEFFCDFHCAGKIGAIVMNCNPFTSGHRYLVEYASGKVDHLIIFVVEEDKSFFTFEQRFEMVKLGVEDIDNVTVVPSGRYIISKETFAQYFEKEVAIDVDDMDYDIYLFGDMVASKLGIRTRFVGTEPTDIVTNRYNERMAQILPTFGIDVEVLERKIEDGQVVSASRVRECYKEEKWHEIEMLCPKSTVDCLRKIKDQ
ncbi:adenylyltransferase/cytidyltransferase family protein [Butyrivibrio sp. AE2032]|uniref:adenylyltransferase/cytidyltransferase family protein n=1 Tax=Butyrivibrio sp. AE2032 TaxID=1458463 RepID=UPI00068FF016|nr:adenylyltransferase/cytidyltransferase family protein [Butyrivibrio sp. AE2032]